MTKIQEAVLKLCEKKHPELCEAMKKEFERGNIKYLLIMNVSYEAGLEAGKASL